MTPENGQCVPNESHHDEWEDLRVKVTAGEVRLHPSAVEAITSRLRSKTTQVLGQHATDDVLVNESYSNIDSHEDDAPPVTRSPLPSHEQTEPILTSQSEVILRIDEAVGRASTYMPRPSNPPDLRIRQPGDADAHERGVQANHRRAVRSASDSALAGSCTIWVTVTFDEVNRSEDPVSDVKRYLRRLRGCHRAATGRPLHYVGVVSQGDDEREHAHLLLSQDVDLDAVRDCWPHGRIISIEQISRTEVEAKVRYMARHVLSGRSTGHRFLKSRQSRPQPLQLAVSSHGEAREVLESHVHPRQVQVIHSQGDDYTRTTYRF